jgi:hypothetical protein
LRLCTLLLCLLAVTSVAHADDDDSDDASEDGSRGDDNEDEDEAHPAKSQEPDTLPDAYVAPDPLPDDYVMLDAGFWLNYTYNLFDKTDRDKQGDFGPGNSMFRVGFTARFKRFIGQVRLRWYSYARVWEYGWMGYRWKNGNQIEVGMTKVPFGVLPFGSYDYWFDIPYYLGFNNQYDVGAKWSQTFLADVLDVQAGVFKNTAIAASDDLARFSYDVVRVAGEPAAQNEETNQVNARLALKSSIVEGGLSLQYGQLYNYDTRKRGQQYAAAVHATATYANISLQLQAMQYLFEPKNLATAPNDVVYVGAFADAYPIAKGGRVLSANVAYDIHVGRVIDSIRCYDNYSVLIKDQASFEDSRMNSLGCSVLAGPVFAFVDWIAAQNAPYLGVPTATAFTAGEPDPRWHSMFNVNLGFYFKTAPLALSH